MKNSLQMVMSMLHLQAGAAEDETVRRQLQEASSRIAAVARAHQRLHQRDEIRTIDLATYLADLCGDLGASVGDCRIELDLQGPVQVPTDRAIPVALVVTEFITNAAKYAYASQAAGRIKVGLAADPARGTRLSVADDGAGLPDGFDPATSRGLGMRIARALAQQIGAQLEVPRRVPRGSEFALVLPPEPATRT